MTIIEQINAALAIATKIKASHLSKRSGVNKGQLSAFLNNGGPLGPAKQGDLVKHLVDMIEAATFSGAQKGKIRLIVEGLRASEQFRVAQEEADPELPILFGHRCYRVSWFCQGRSGKNQVLT